MLNFPRYSIDKTRIDLSHSTTDANFVKNLLITVGAQVHPHYAIRQYLKIDEPEVELHGLNTRISHGYDKFSAVIFNALWIETTHSSHLPAGRPGIRLPKMIFLPC